MNLVNYSVGGAALLCLAGAAGCGESSDPGHAQVSGVVLYEGRSVEGASVVFHPLETDTAMLSSLAETDASGKFLLKSHAGGGVFKPGTAPGRYAVVITKLDIAKVAGLIAPPKNLLPKKYADPKTSGFTAEVAVGKYNDFEFPLSAK